MTAKPKRLQFGPKKRQSSTKVKRLSLYPKAREAKPKVKTLQWVPTREKPIKPAPDKLPYFKDNSKVFSSKSTKTTRSTPSTTKPN